MHALLIMLCLLKLSLLANTQGHYVHCLSERVANIQAGGVIMNLSLKRYQAAHHRLIKEIEKQVKKTAKHTGIKYLSPKVSKALELVPRHLFVRPGDEYLAYDNTALPIGEGQTISQPFIVAIMTELLDVHPFDKVLEVGTGSGYQAAILSQLADAVYSVETIPALAQTSQQKLTQFGYGNVHVSKRDGAQGWKEHAPYNKIIVTAASETIPQALLEQLANDGIMILPLGKPNRDQRLTVVRKNKQGEITQHSVLAVKFVPFS